MEAQFLAYGQALESENDKKTELRELVKQVCVQTADKTMLIARNRRRLK